MVSAGVITILVAAALVAVELRLLVLGSRLLGLPLAGFHELEALSILHRRSILQ